MPDDGIQIILFTHQDARIWADMAAIMWGAGLQVKASFPVRLADYAISEPRYLGVGVKDTVQVNVTFSVAQ